MVYDAASAPGGATPMDVDDVEPSEAGAGPGPGSGARPSPPDPTSQQQVALVFPGEKEREVSADGCVCGGAFGLNRRPDSWEAIWSWRRGRAVATWDSSLP